MLDGLTDAVEVIADLLERASGLNSGNTPAPGPTGAGSAGSGAAGGSGSGDPPDGRRRPGPDDPSHDPLDTLIDLHDPMLQDNVDHLVDLVNDATSTGRRTARPLRDHLTDLLTSRTRPRFPGNPTEQLLSQEGADAMAGGITAYDELYNRHENLASSNFDYAAYEARRQARPLSRRRETAVERGGDTATNRFKDWFWGRTASDGGGAGE